MIIANHQVTHCLAVLVFVHCKQADTAKDAKLGKGLGATSWARRSTRQPLVGCAAGTEQDIAVASRRPFIEPSFQSLQDCHEKQWDFLVQANGPDISHVVLNNFNPIKGASPQPLSNYK